jgi:hypothetical protein
MITVKEEFLGDDKTKRAIKAGGYEALAMWLALKRYCAEHLTDGFIPDEDIDDLPDAPPNPRKRLQALVGCGRLQRDGSRGNGLVDAVENGWQLHDYLHHASSRAQEEQRREKARTRKERWQERRSANPGNDDPDGIGTDVDDDPEHETNATGTPSPVRGHTSAPSPAQPVDPTSQKSEDLEENQSPDPDLPAKSGSAGAGAGRKKPERSIPEPFPLTDEHIAHGAKQDWPEWWLRIVHEDFCGKAKAKGWRYVEWNSAFYNFARGEVQKYHRGPKDLAHLAPATAPAFDSDAEARRARAAAVEAKAKAQVAAGRPS